MTQSKVYLTEETAITWSPGGGNDISLDSLASGAGIGGVSVDLGATPRARRYVGRLKTRFATDPVFAEGLVIAFARSMDNTDFDSGLGTSDAALSSIHELANAMQVRVLQVHVQTASGNDFVTHFEFETSARYLKPLVWNSSADGLSSTGSHHELKVWPVPDAVQEAA